MTNVLDRLRKALVDRYTIEREIGRGMAVVYLAHDLKHNRQVAIKVMRSELSTSLFADRFLREIEVTAKLHHPHILPLLDSGDAGGLLYYIMPLAEGESLRDRLNREKQLPINEAIRIASEVASALSYAHGCNVVHRDVKPENILLQAGQAVVADFGIVSAMAEVGGEKLTETGVAVGTPGYMSPEQASGESDVDGRSDVYSLGCVLYEMLTGEPPFTGPTAESVIRKHISADPTLVSALRPSVSDEIASTVKRALEKSPVDRFATAGEFGETLGVALVTPTALEAAKSKRPARWIAVVAIAAAALVAVLAMLLPGPTDAGPPTIAVLPPLTLGSAEDLSFAEGVAEAVHARLWPVSGLTVKARYSAEQYDITGKTYSEIGEDLGLDYMVKLTAHREQETDDRGTVFVSTDLIRATDGQSVWNRQYEEPLESYMEVNRSIAELVVQELDVALAAPERERLASDPTTSLAAWQHYERGRRYLASTTGGEGFRLARQQFGRAIEKDSTFALAWASLSMVQPDDSASSEALQRAFQLDSGLADVQVARVASYYLARELETARQLVQEILETQPSHPGALDFLGVIQRRQGQWDEALETLKRVAELNPLGASSAYSVSWTLLGLGNYDEAEPYVDRAIDLAPEVNRYYIFKAWVRLARDGHVDAAEQVLLDAIDRIGLQEVMQYLVLRNDRWLWFGILSEPFRQHLQDYTATTLGADSAQYYLARALSEETTGDTGRATEWYDRARLILERRLDADPEDAQLRARLGIAYAGVGRKEDAVSEALRGVRIMPVTQDAFDGPTILFHLARVYVMVGDHENAIDELETLLNIPSSYSKAFLRVHPLFDPLRDDPRFQALLNEN